MVNETNNSVINLKSKNFHLLIGLLVLFLTNCSVDETLMNLGLKKKEKNDLSYLLGLAGISNRATVSSNPTPVTNTNLGNCTFFPANNIWNKAIDLAPLDSNSSNYISSIGSARSLKVDFGSGLYQGSPIGIPYTTVSSSQQLVPISFTYSSESDPSPYPIPSNPPIEGGYSSTGDRHVLVVDRDNCILYELYSAYPQSNGSWNAGSGAKFNLTSNALRTDGWTSADAAGLPILPGLVRYDEILAGEIKHAIRFTVSSTQRKYVWPARHYASSNTSTSLPPMGQRFRLMANVDISSYSQTNRIILTAMKKYGIILADNGSNWYVSGVPDDRWDNDDLARLGNIKGSQFEAVDVSSYMVNINSGQAN